MRETLAAQSYESLACSYVSFTIVLLISDVYMQRSLTSDSYKYDNLLWEEMPHDGIDMDETMLESQESLVCGYPFICTGLLISECVCIAVAGR